MPSLSLKIIQDDGAVTRKVKFDSRMTIKEAHKVVKDKVIVPDPKKEYALFLRSADNNLTGIWLQDDKTLEYYMLKDGDSLDYICTVRNLRIRLLDGSVKTLQVDEPKSVGELMMDICARIGITNYDEYGLCHEETDVIEGKESKEPATGTLTLRRKQQQPTEQDAALKQLCIKLKTDDNVDWLDQHRTLREQGIDCKETLLLKRRLFYSDRNVDERDPVQLQLLYVQTKDAILIGRHPVTEQQAADFAGIQCQVNFGDFQEKKHKPGFIENLQEYLPEQYSNAWGVEKKILKAYSQHQGLNKLEAMFLYIKTARALPTYGVTFFLVKEKQKDKKKLVPRLLGINSEAILRLDEVTKEILQQWPLTHVKTYHAGKSQTFTLNFGDYSDKEYSVKTHDCLRIRDILEGYIDIIRRRMLAKPHAHPGDSMAIYHDNVQAGKSHLIEHVSHNPSKVVTETFVGPSRLMPYDQGSQAHSGATLTTVQQIVVTDHLQNQQQALKGEIPVRGDMSQECVKKLNRMNSNSVKIVGLLTDPNDVNMKDAQKIVENMQEDLPVVEKGVKETAEQQTLDGAKKMLLDELQDLNTYMNKLATSTRPGQTNPDVAKDAAENIADLTTQMYFSIDPKTRRRSEMLQRSRKSFKAGEKQEQTIRRASFIAAATSALHSVDTAKQTLNGDYSGDKLDDAQRKKLEKSLEDRMGKLNAAIALYLTAHSDPESIDFSAAINSMNDIHELMPELAKEAQMLASTKDPTARKELQNDMRTLFEATRNVCGMSGTEDHEKMQEATNQYADIAGKLIFSFARGTNAEKENQIIGLAKDAGDKTSLLLITANELTCQAAAEPAAADVDAAGVRTAGAARDLLACAQLTAPAIHEPHCRSALSAACEGLASSVHNMEASWKPLLEDPTRQPMSDQLHTRGTDVIKALERLKDAYTSLGDVDGVDDTSLPLQERQRLKFITTMSGAKDRLQGVDKLWNEQSAAGSPTEQQKMEAQHRLEQKLAQLNAAVAALAVATADRENPDYATAELAISTISELMPQIIKDTEVVSSDKDPATRSAMLQNVRVLCDAARDMCQGDGYRQGQGEAASNFAAASGKLVFLISPGADKAKKKHVMDVASAACDKSSELLSQARRVRELAPADTQLGAGAARLADAAQALHSVAQLTAPSIGEARCQDALSSALQRLNSSAADLTSSCQQQLQQRPDMQQHSAAMSRTQKELDDHLRKLDSVCQSGQNGHSYVAPSAQQEKQRLKFINSISGAKSRLDAAEERLKDLKACQMMKEEDAAVLQHQLSQRLAQLNAAVAGLAAATADRDNPDHTVAEKAISTISDLMPHIVQDSRILCGTMNEAGRDSLVQDVRALCEACREVCDSAAQPQGVGEAAGKFAAASGKLVFLVSPRTDNEKENEVLDLSSSACGKASELLAQVQSLTEQIEPNAAAELDSRGARAADAAQALLTVAQATGSTISDPRCQEALVSAAEKLRSSAAELTTSCGPHLQQRRELQQQVLSTQQQLHDKLDKLVHACKTGHADTSGDASLAQQEKQRLKFISTVSGAKSRLDAAEQRLKEPVVSQLKPAEAAALQHKLSQRLAQLNAAVAALAAATADREKPDYAAAERAAKTITELMPQIAQDSHVLSGTKDGARQAAMLQDIRALCEASREICDSAGQPQGLGEAAAKFSTASGKLVFLISPKAHDAQEKEVVGLSAAACGKTTELLAQVQSLTEQLEQAEPNAAAELDSRGARAADAAQALLTVAQATGSTISDPRCQEALVSAAEKLRTSAAELTTSCGPHLQQRRELQQQVLSTQQQLHDKLDKLIHACKTGHADISGDASSAQQEKQRLKFISTVSGAKTRLDAAEQRLKEPVVSQLKPAEAAALQHKLSQRLAQLNAAVAALAAATADREKPDYAAAERAVKTITELMPQIAQDSHVLSGTKDGAGQAAMLQEVRALCEASREICNSAGQPQGLSEAAAKFSAASGKLVFLTNPEAHDAQEKEVVGLSAAACGKTTELLAQVQSLTEQLQQTEPNAAAELDSRGARAADAAQALLTVAQATGSTISDPRCQEALVSAAEKLRSSAAELTTSCGPHLQQRRELQQQVLTTQQQLHDKLDKLVQACKTGHADNSGVASSAQQEKQRLKFISTVSGAKSRLDAAEQQLKEPVVSQLKPAEAAALQHKLSQRLAQLNAAVAALAAATADREKPDYAAAERAAKTITELVPQIAQDSHVLSGTKDGAGQAAMLQDIRALCDASREICDSAGQPQGLNEAATKFSAASGKLVFLISPNTHDAQEKEVIGLSAAACGKTTELLAQVQSLTEQLEQTEPNAAAELDSRGARAADAAQALLTVAQLTASSISDPSCSAELISSAEKLRTSVAELTTSCGPHLQQRPEVQQQVLSSKKQLDDNLNRLIQACKAAQQGAEVPLSPQQEKQRLHFVGSMSGAKKRLEAIEQLIKEPVLCQMMKQQDSEALQHKLSQRLAQLNAAVAALNAATSDGKNPDYQAAERAVINITELMPQIVQDSCTLSGTKDEAGQAAMLEQLRALCESSRAICDSAGHPKKLREGSAKLANASGKLLFLTTPDGKQQMQIPTATGPKPVPGKKPPVPVRDPKFIIAHAAPATDKRISQTQDFLEALRSEENRDNPVKIVGLNAKTSPTSPNVEKQGYEQFSKMIDTIEEEMKSAEDGLKVLHDGKSITLAGAPEPVPALEVTRREQRMEDNLARAGVEVASLVSANYADKLDYKAAMEPTMALMKSVRSIVEDGGVISGSLYVDSRKPFIDDLTGLCHATRDICKAARSDKEKLNDAAISFGNQSAKLLRVVSSEVNPCLEKEVISRAKDIGDTASRVALEASNVAEQGSSPLGGSIHVQDICTAGTRCIDAAGKLVYTAKLVAPTVHHSTCQDALISSADSLSSSLATFSNTWKPLASAKQPNVEKLTEETRRLEELLENLRKDIRVGKLGKKKEDQLINLDMPLRQMAVEIKENAKDIAEHGELQPDLKKEYSSYSNRLVDAIRALDLANARYQRALHDKNKRSEMEIATQDLQMTVLQTRPSRAGQENNNIVDFRDFLQDLAKEAEELQQTAKKNEGPAGKRVTEDIKLLCTTISEDANKLLHPADNRGDGVTVMTSVDDVMDIAQFGQECDVLVKEINAVIQGVHDQKAKQALRAKALLLTESCHLLRFATNSHISATKSAEFDEVLQDLEKFETSVLQPLVSDAMQKKKQEKNHEEKTSSGWRRAGRARAALAQAVAGAGAGRPARLAPALAFYCAAVLADGDDSDDDKNKKDVILKHLKGVLKDLHCYFGYCSTEASNFEGGYCQSTDNRKWTILKELTELDHEIAVKKFKIQVLNAEDIDKLLFSDEQKVEGTQKQLEEKVQQLSSKLSSMSNTALQSVAAPAGLARSLRAAAAAAASLAAAARALQQYKKPLQSKKIMDAANEMCLATYNLMKTSELVCQDPNHHDSRRKMMEACHNLNDSINKLVRSSAAGGRGCVERGEALRGLQLQRSALVAAPQPRAAMPYAHCLDTLHSQRDILQKLNSDQAMSRDEFLQSMCYVTSAANNSAECVAHAAYLLSVSEKDKTIGKEGIVDVSKLQKDVGEVESSCVSIIMGQHEEQMQEERKVLQTHVQDLLNNLNDTMRKTKKGPVKDMLLACRDDVISSSKALYNGIDQKRSKPEIISLATSLMDAANNVADVTDHPDLVPTVGNVSADTQAKVDEVVKSSLSLLTNTEDLIKQVNVAPEDPEVMKWVMFNKRKDVLDAFEKLLKSIKSNGVKAGLLEGSMEDPEEEKKSYVQKQFDTASKWLLKPMSKAEVKSNGQQAVTNLLEVAKKITEDLKGSDKDDMRNLVEETQQLLTECTKKYDHEQYSVLMERVRELKKGIERGVVTRVVEDFMEAEAPLADLDVLSDYEKDESKRKFLLEKKIAELLAHLGRITKTARLIAHTDGDDTTVGTQLNTCSQHAELLAPMLVKAAQQRVASPDDKAVIENYKSLLARYAESVSKIRDLCDQSVDPMDFVQTAGETMERMREESAKHNDPMKCAHTSAAITKLANRVIHVGMSSSCARSDPELAQALAAAQHQLAAAAPPAGTRASRMPDWRDTTAKILQATEQVESLLGGETIFKQQPEPNQPIYNEALNLHFAIRDWSSRDNEIVAVAKRMAVLMAKLSNFMNNDKQHDVLATSKSIVTESHEVARLAKKLAHECTDHRIKTNLLQTCERIPTISGQLKMLTTVKGFSLGRHGTQEDKEAMDMLVGNAQSLMLSIQDVVKGAASASVKIMSQRGPRMKEEWKKKMEAFDQQIK